MKALAAGRARSAGAHADVTPVEWLGDRVRILDQRELPRQERYIEAADVATLAGAIRSMAVRGAPLLGIAAGYGMALAAATSTARGPKGLLGDLDRAGRTLVSSRPTAVNVAWAVGRVMAAARAAALERGEPSPARGGKTAPAAASRSAENIRRATIREAGRISAAERASCLAIGRFGSDLVPLGANVLTHCNTGILATGWAGTAQAVITTAHDAGKRVHVWVNETRPVLQGSRLTSWELQRKGVPMTLVADTVAGSLMARGSVDLVVVGADRIAANGDTANKVGTYQLAVLARYHGLPFYVAAPVSTIDPNTPNGDAIVLEERDRAEVTTPFGVAFAPTGTRAANPAFDVTPARLIGAIVTDRGIARRPYVSAIRRLLRGEP